LSPVYWSQLLTTMENFIKAPGGQVTRLTAQLFPLEQLGKLVKLQKIIPRPTLLKKRAI
jgi:hypothetical protein